MIEENYEVDTKSRAIKDYFKSWRFWRPFLAAFIGGVLGFLYYYYVGCTSGHCAITSNPYMSILWGGMMGYFIVSSPCSRGKC
jgi:hypothetical protein